VIVGIVVLAEPFRWSLVLGAALVVAGVALTRSPPSTEVVCAAEGVATEVGP
jgi:drug/metabolite transporter (DMT)-like permease